MLHPIFSTVLGHPGLIADHLANYAALIREEAGEASRGLIARLIAGVLAAISGMLALTLIGIAVMMGVFADRFHWVLVIVPGVASIVAIVSTYVAMRPTRAHQFDELRAQLATDIQALKLAGDRDGQ